MFRLLQGKPAPKPVKKKRDEEEDAEAEEEEEEEEEEELTPEETKMREELNAAHERFDAGKAPATCAVAHCGVAGVLRRYAATNPYLRALWALLEPLVPLRTRRLLARRPDRAGSVTGAATPANFLGGRDATLPKGGEWFVALLSPAERVAGKPSDWRSVGNENHCPSSSEARRRHLPVVVDHDHDADVLGAVSNSPPAPSRRTACARFVAHDTRRGHGRGRAVSSSVGRKRLRGPDAVMELVTTNRPRYRWRPRACFSRCTKDGSCFAERAR